MVNSTLHIENESIMKALWSVTDPEIPVLSIMDMGVVRQVDMENDLIIVSITPTYSGCPAMDTIGDDIKKALKEEGYQSRVKLVLAPAWTTDWITERGRKKLAEYGIAPPMEEAADKAALIDGERLVKCTHCGSTNTRMISQFGSTACKALFQCNECDEPFDYFKCLK